jgi:predicted dienelactone hydrolase
MRSALAIALTSVLALSTAAPATALPARARAAEEPATQLVLPRPTGPERIGTVSLHLVDRSRPDPWVPSESAREIMVQLWYPASGVRRHPRAPWVSPGVAERINPPGSPVILPVTHAYADAPVEPGSYPVVLYSPGFGLERTASTALVEELASRGYIVVTIDHTHDAQLVEFPGGRIATHAIPPPTGPDDNGEQVINTARETRVADTRFTLDRLAAINRGHHPDEERRRLPRGLKGALDLARVGMFGHSLGGATAAETMYEDPRVGAGINMDGTLSGAVVGGGLDRPLALMSSDGHGRADDETWLAIWPHLRGPRYDLQLAGSGHMSFTDLQVLLPQAGIPAEDLVPDYGTIDGARSITVQRAYVLAFFDRYLRNRNGSLLAGPSRRYPEMRFTP